MGKQFGIIIAILLITYQLHSCVAFDLIGMISSAVGLGQFVTDIIKSLRTGQSVDYVMREIEQLNFRVMNDMTMVIDMLKELPDFIVYAVRLNDFQQWFTEIEHHFKTVIRKKMDVDEKIYDYNNTEYENLDGRRHHMSTIMAQIKRTLIDGNATSIFTSHFTQHLLKFEDACKTKMSQMQLLDALLAAYQAIIAQYYIASKSTLEFMELKGKNNARPLEILKEDVNRDYKDVVTQFHTEIMPHASLELWACDPPNGYNDAIRFTVKSDPNFTELRMKSIFLFNEKETDSGGGSCTYAKSCTEVHSLENCLNPASNLCRSRMCPNELMNCKTITTQYKKNSVSICQSNNRNAYHRYRSIVNSSSELPCDEKYESFILHTVTYHGRGFSGRACDNCQCTCLENQYYIDVTEHSAGDVDEFGHFNVITGAQIVIEMRVLRLQIQTAKLLRYGKIDQRTLKWQPLPPLNTSIFQKFDPPLDDISPDMKISLRSLIGDRDQAITTLGFMKLRKNTSETNAERMLLLVPRFTQFDFETGKCVKDCQSSVHLYTYVREAYNMSEQDVPTKGINTTRYANKPLSTDEQYVSLTVSSLAKDGGQSVLPFIDTQRVEAHAPLSGVSLFIRGQPGYGGFLGIKLYTFDFRSHVDPESTIA